MGFVSGGALSVLVAFTVRYALRSLPLWVELICAGIFTLVFTIWGFISGEKMIEELAHL